MPRRGLGGRTACGTRRVAAAWLLSFLLTPVVRAESLPPGIELRLPPDIVYLEKVGADRAVVFRHASHVAFAGNRCTGCHPAPFRLLSPVHRVTHAEMNAGGSCAICHDGRHAFSSRDSASCSTCHAGLPSRRSTSSARAGAPQRPLPKPITFARGEVSPGPVTFRHETHVGGKRTCVTCHPRPFAMTAATRGAGAMHQSDACGSCHDGKRSFAVESAQACGRCHGGGATP